MGIRADAHGVERAVDEGERNDEKECSQDVSHTGVALARGEFHGKLDGQQAEERGELDDRVQSDGGSVLERITDRVANDGGVMQVVAQFNALKEKQTAPAGLVVGGLPEGRQLDAIRKGAQLVVATPGRLEDYLDRRLISLGGVATLVLDEADRMPHRVRGEIRSPAERMR